MQKKYELVKESEIQRGGFTLYRIRALIDIPTAHVKAGDLGGWIHCEKNLAHDGTCWVANAAIVTDEACVKDDAQVADHAVIKDEAIVDSSARVYGSAIIRGKAVVTGYARVYGNAVVERFALVAGRAWIYGKLRITDRAEITGSADLSGEGIIGGYIQLSAFNHGF